MTNNQYRDDQRHSTNEDNRRTSRGSSSSNDKYNEGSARYDNNYRPGGPSSSQNSRQRDLNDQQGNFIGEDSSHQNEDSSSSSGRPSNRDNSDSDKKQHGQAWFSDSNVYAEAAYRGWKNRENSKQ